MKVPEPVRYIFNLFPLYQLQSLDKPELIPQAASKKKLVLGVYSLDGDGFPQDPQCLAMYCLLLLQNIHPNVQIMSAYSTSNETLPVLWKPKEVSSHSPIQHFPRQVEIRWSEILPENTSAEVKVYKSLLETWIEDAWHETIMSTDYASTKRRLYEDIDTTTLPWVFSRLAGRQLDEHLDARHARSKQGKGDDYMCTPINMHRVAMALEALSSAIQAQPTQSTPSLLDVMVFSYIWPIMQCIGESALAQLITPNLREHAYVVRDSLIDLRQNASL